MLAIGPQLLAVIPSPGTLLNDGQILHFAPSELTLRFDTAIDGSTLVKNNVANIQFTRGGDHILGNGNDVNVTLGYLAIGDNPNEVIARFANNLPDDLYQVRIIGAGATPLKGLTGQTFNGGADLTQKFTLDLGAQVVAVVPQPVSRDSSTGVLSQATTEIDVYFNVNDRLDLATATTPANYELIRTGGTATNADDQLFNPTTVTYDPNTGKAVLLFTGADAVKLTTPGLYRLRVGNNDPLALAPTNPVGSGPAGSSFATSDNLGTVFTATQGNQSLTVIGTIGGAPINVVYPGGDNDPGTRNIPPDLQDHLLAGADTSGAIPVIQYNFQSSIGTVLGSPAFNVITDTQKQRVREVLSYYANYLGVEFIETSTSGWTIATGDVRTVDPNVPANGVGGIAGGSLAVMSNSVDWGSSESGGAYFTTAMHEIGHLLGLGHTYELPPLAVQGSAETLGSSPAAEPVFPGDSDILLGQFLHPPAGNEIDIYKFTLARAGQLNLETVAERLRQFNSAVDPSQLNTVITVFDASGNIVARNDDYYGNDSFVQLQLSSGLYYVAITSTGNTNFDPTIANTGFGGTTQGAYALRLTFTPTQTSGIKDTTGTLLDGDMDGAPGGTYNFWFRVASTAQTLFVDKAAVAGAGTLGSITNPYTTISNALAVATPGSVVRIVGNGGADHNLATPLDNLSFNIGFDSLNRPLSDGSKLEVPQGVTVMIDAGAIIKVRGANIDVGTSAQGLDRSAGAVQVLGTPEKNAQGLDIGTVYFTSFYNTALGTDPNTAKGTLASGNWGGIVFRNDSDLEANGIFLNYVNHANISYGGGQVLVNSVLQVYDPIHLVTSRPAISFNTITKSADAAVSADPDSFEESEFKGPTFDLDYSRVGPSIHGNTLSNNSINGLFVRIRTQNGASLDTLTTSARFSTTDMIYVIEENLLIQGQPGGLIADAGGRPLARQSARLAIDPGVVVKLGGARIETQIGAQLIAEGTAAGPIVFTSIFDDRYGDGGAFDTTNDGAGTTAAEGNWGGLFFGPLSIGSVDHALITFAGGSTTIEGGFAIFDAVEIHQAQVRLANNTLEHNAGGGDSSGRNGRTSATPAVIFVRGAQPVILNNIIQNNDVSGLQVTAAININVNALTSRLVTDWGRSTGTADIQVSSLTNAGPLIRDNRLGNNPINGMIVRGGTITTDVVWDDTDIVHVLQDEVIAPNRFSLSGRIRLQSSPTESLVVKLSGNSAGFTASGVPLDINDRTGGTVQIVGVGNHPVVLTSLVDTTVGAGVTPAGLPQNDTRNQKGALGATPPAAGDWRSIRLDTYSNDTNMDLVNEFEAGFSPNGDTNSLSTTAQFLGGLAKDSKSGDDNLRLGYEIHGSVSQTVVSPGGGDVDVYSFQGTAGSTVWFDIDRTSQSLDSVVELVDANGAVLARSDNSIPESTNAALLVGIAKPMQIGFTNSAGPFTNPDFYTTNPLDAGMRLDLPGAAGTVNTYFVRVRASSGDLTALNKGLTKGEYVLQIRLQNEDQFPGSTIRNADIRYANSGVEVIGKPELSPLLGDTAQTIFPNTFATAQDLGNLLTSSQNEISVAGNLATATSVVWFKMELNYDLIQSVGGFSNGLKTFAAMFNINYADGLNRPDTTLSIFNANGDLLLIGRDSSVPDGQPTPTAGSDTTNLGHGNFGNLDPTIGSVQMGAGGPQPAGSASNGQVYYIAVSSNAMLPTILDATFKPTATNSLTRLEPLNSVARIVDDRIGSTGGPTADPSQQIFSGGVADPTPAQLNLSATPFQLGDVVTYVTNGFDLYTINPFTGQLQTDITHPASINSQGGSQLFIGENVNLVYQDLAMRDDGRLFMYPQGTTTGTDTPTVNGAYRQIDAGSAELISSQSANPIQTFDLDATTPVNPANGQYQFVTPLGPGGDHGFRVEAMAFNTTNLFSTSIDDSHGRQLYVVGSRNFGNQPRGIYDINDITGARNVLYRMDPNSGAPIADDLITNTQTHPAPNGITYTAYQPDAREAQLAGTGTNVVPRGVLTTGNYLSAVQATDSELTLVTSAATAQINAALDVRDGQQFFVGLTPFQFVGGPQLTLNPNGATDPNPALSIHDGQTFKINNKIFEFNAGGPPQPRNPTHVLVPFKATDTMTVLGGEINAAVNGAGIGVTASFSRNRILFLNANAATTDLSSFPASYVVTPATPVPVGTIPITFLATDSASQMATKIGTAINGALIPYTNGAPLTVTTQVNGSNVTITGALPTLFNTPWMATRSDDIRDGMTFTVGSNDPSFLPVLQVRFPSSLAATLIADGQTFKVNGTTFEFDRNGTFNQNNVQIVFTQFDSNDTLGNAIADAINGANIVGLSAHFSVGRLTFAGVNFPTTDLSSFTGSFQVGINAPTKTFEFESGPQVTIANAAVAAFIPDGQSFVVNGKTFEFDSDGTHGVNNVPVVYTATDSVATLGASIANAVSTAGIGVTATFVRDRVMFLGAVNATTNLTSFSAAQGFVRSGSSGVTPGTFNIPVNFSADDSAQEIAQAIAVAINTNAVPNQNGIGSGALPDALAFAENTFVKITNASVVDIDPSSPIISDIPDFNNIFSTFTGNITGIAFAQRGTDFTRDNRMYAVSDAGSIYEVMDYLDEGPQGVTMNSPVAASLVKNGQTFTLNGVVFEFDNDGHAPGGPPGNLNTVISYLPTDTVIAFSAKIASAVNSAPTSVSASFSATGVRFFGIDNATSDLNLFPTISPTFVIQHFLPPSSSDVILTDNQANLRLMNIVTEADGTHPRFTGLSPGPLNVEGGKYKDILFATDEDGKIWAIDSTTGQLAPIFIDGATSVDTGLLFLVGITMSEADYNLWHVTTSRGGDAGHDGGQSFYFGLEDPDRLASEYEQPESENYKIFPGDAQTTGNPTLFNSYNVPGGAAGSLTSGTFSLAGYSAFDKPTLYFNYAADTEVAPTADSNGFRDSFRVFASDDGVIWTELGTNDSSELPAVPSVSGGVYQGGTTKQIRQELFDATGNVTTVVDRDPNHTFELVPGPTTLKTSDGTPSGVPNWRQARVDLGDFAGKSNIRLRFDFSSSGAMATAPQFEALRGVNLGAVYLGGVDATKVRDAQTFSLGNTVQTGTTPGGDPIFTTTPYTFTFREGLALMAPVGGGVAIIDHETFTAGGKTFELTKSGSVTGSNVAVLINDNMTPEGVATAIATAITNTPSALITPIRVGARVQLVGAASLVQSPAHGLIVEGSALPATLANTDVTYTIDMTAEQIASQVGKALDAKFAELAGNVDDPNILTSSKLVGGVLQVYGHTIVSPGPLLTGTLPGDTLADTYDSISTKHVINITNEGAQRRGRDNAHEGVFVDDIVVGFAGRGEMVSGNKVPFVGNIGDTPTGINTFDIAADPTDPSRINAGVFQLDIRRGTEYGTVASPVTGGLSLFRTFDINDRLTQGLTLVSLPASQLVDGQTFAINTEFGTFTFEFDRGNGVTAGNFAVVIHNDDSAATVATAIRDAINNVPAALKFAVKANVYSNGTRINLFGAVDVRPGPLTVITFNNLGDTTPLRVQGETVVQGNRISNTAQAGIGVVPQLVGGVILDVPGHTGSNSNLSTLNASKFVPGVSLKDNLIIQGGLFGILISGSPQTDISHAIPFARVINNTIVQTPTGIQVSNNASPTILNNVIALTGVAINVDNTSTTTVVGASVYQSNSQNLLGALETNSIFLQPNAPLFVDTSKGNFYLKAGTSAIDSSVNSLQERPGLTAVGLPLGIPASPIQAPDYDLLGQLRVDDPTVPSPPGLGSNVFKDRGALERADNIGPSAMLLGPVDNDSDGDDRNPALNKVVLVGHPLYKFIIQLNDLGVGVDDSALDVTKFVIQRTVGNTTTTLTPNVDYTLAYDSTNKIASLLPVVGVWTNATYTITLNNSTQAIKDLAGNLLQANDPTGITQFSIQLSDTATSSWQNPRNKFDVNDDGIVAGLDVLLLINRLLANQGGPLPPVVAAPPYLDVNGDGSLTPLDALQIINFLNNGGSAAPAAAPAAAPMAATSLAGAGPTRPRRPCWPHRRRHRQICRRLPSALPSVNRRRPLRLRAVLPPPRARAFRPSRRPRRTAVRPRARPR